MKLTSHLLAKAPGNPDTQHTKSPCSSFRTLTVFLLAAVTALCAGAQEKKTARGMVVDNDGIPVAGAVVTVKGSDMSTFTDTDGVFSLEVPVTVKNIIVSYPDMYTEKVKIKSYGNTIVTMKSSDRTKWFIDGAISPVISFGNRCGTFSDGTGISIMGGFYRQWGAYVKFGSDFNGAGVIKPISDKVCLYAGVGLGLNRYCRIRKEEGSWWDDGYMLFEDHDFAPALAIDAGCMVRMSRKFNMTFGVTYITPRHGNSGNLCVPVIGLGYTFN